MKIPIHYEHTRPSGLPVFSDEDHNTSNPDEICYAINNAATGPWEKGPVVEGEEGDIVLFMFLNTDGTPPYIVLVRWCAGKWWCDNITVLKMPDMFCRVNIPSLDTGGADREEKS